MDANACDRHQSSRPPPLLPLAPASAACHSSHHRHHGGRRGGGRGGREQRRRPSSHGWMRALSAITRKEVGRRLRRLRAVEAGVSGRSDGGHELWYRLQVVEAAVASTASTPAAASAACIHRSFTDCNRCRQNGGGGSGDDNAKSGGVWFGSADGLTRSREQHRNKDKQENRSTFFNNLWCQRSRRY